MTAENTTTIDSAEEAFTAITGEQAPEKHTLLEVWTELLSNVEQSAKEPVQMMQAATWLQKFPWLSTHELQLVHEIQHEMLAEARDILSAVIEDEPQALKRVETDGTDNRHLYLNVLILWQQMLRLHETQWRARAAGSGAAIAAYVETTQMLVGENGLLAHLDQIGFDANPSDIATVHQAIYGEEAE